MFPRKLKSPERYMTFEKGEKKAVYILLTEILYEIQENHIFTFLLLLFIYKSEKYTRNSFYSSLFISIFFK